MEDRLPILSSDIILKTNSHKYGFCSGQLHFRRAIGIFLSLCWHSPLRKTQTTVASVNQPLLYNVITTTSLQINSSQGRINFSFNFKIRRRCETDHPWLTPPWFFCETCNYYFSISWLSIGKRWRWSRNVYQIGTCSNASWIVVREDSIDGHADTCFNISSPIKKWHEREQRIFTYFVISLHNQWISLTLCWKYISYI